VVHRQNTIKKIKIMILGLLIQAMMVVILVLDSQFNLGVLMEDLAPTNNHVENEDKMKTKIIITKFEKSESINSNHLILNNLTEVICLNCEEVYTEEQMEEDSREGKHNDHIILMRDSKDQFSISKP